MTLPYPAARRTFAHAHLAFGIRRPADNILTTE